MMPTKIAAVMEVMSMVTVAWEGGRIILVVMVKMEVTMEVTTAVAVNVESVKRTRGASEQAQQQSKTQKQKNGVLGMKLQALDDDDKEKTQLDYGLRVLSIEDGPAKAAGVRTNDIVQMIDGEKVDSIKKLKELIKDLAAGKYVSVLVQRPQGPQFLAMQIPSESEQQ